MTMDQQRYNLATNWELVREYFYDQIDTESRQYLSITFTLYKNNDDILTQFRKASAEISDALFFWSERYAKKKVLWEARNEVSPYFEELIIIPELTKEFNIHFHGFIKIDNHLNFPLFHNEVKKFCTYSKYIGSQFKLKHYDDLQQVLNYGGTCQGYPFKDLKEVLFKFPDSHKMWITHFKKLNKNEENILNKRIIENQEFQKQKKQIQKDLEIY
jgi:hypothetical protein